MRYSKRDGGGRHAGGGRGVCFRKSGLVSVSDGVVDAIPYPLSDFFDRYTW